MYITKRVETFHLEQCRRVTITIKNPIWTATKIWVLRWYHQTTVVQPSVHMLSFKGSTARGLASCSFSMPYWMAGLEMCLVLNILSIKDEQFCCLERHTSLNMEAVILPFRCRNHSLQSPCFFCSCLNIQGCSNCNLKIL